eukprot:UC1_evm1s395
MAYRIGAHYWFHSARNSARILRHQQQQQQRSSPSLAIHLTSTAASVSSAPYIMAHEISTSSVVDKAIPTTSATTTTSGLLGVVFDMDGTLTADGAIDFDEMRQRVKAPTGTGILAHVHTLVGSEREQAEAAILECERDAYGRMALAPGCAETITALSQAGLKLGILTRNTDEAIDYFLETFSLRNHFDVTLSREFKGMPKPAPDALLHILKLWDMEPRQILMVGDHVDDVKTGRAAGTHTALLRLPKNGKEEFQHADHGIDSLVDLIKLCKGLGP